MTVLLEAVASGKDPNEPGDLKVADAVWVGTAILHEQNPDTSDFTTEQIVTFVAGLHLTRGTQKSIWQHVNQHCVANREPLPNRSRMLTATGKGNRRLFRNGDTTYAGREGAPTHPEWSSLPTRYRYLERWYNEWNGSTGSAKDDPLLRLVGSGTNIWKHQHADEFVAGLREGWGGR
jgi:hypothetical protein